MTKGYFVSILLLSAPAMFAAEYKIDPAHSSAEFSVRHLMISNVKGQFSKLSGEIVYDPANPSAAKVDAVIDTTTVDTREARRDDDLKGPHFFDVTKFPTMSFKSTHVEKSGEQLLVKGDLTLHGVTKEVTLTVDGPTPEMKDPRGNVHVGASATTHINRKDWGLVWNAALESGGVMVGDDVKITLDIEAVKAKPETAGK